MSYDSVRIQILTTTEELPNKVILGDDRSRKSASENLGIATDANRDLLRTNQYILGTIIGQLGVLSEKMNSLSEEIQMIKNHLKDTDNKDLASLTEKLSKASTADLSNKIDKLGQQVSRINPLAKSQPRFGELTIQANLDFMKVKSKDG